MVSSGAVLAAAVELNENKKMKDKNTIIIIPSFAERYLSTQLFNEIWKWISLITKHSKDIQDKS